MPQRFIMPSSRITSALMIAVVFAGHLCFTAAAQSIAPVGTSQTLDIGTWNIEWFGDSSNGPSDEMMQRQNVELIIKSSGIDIWSVQEIADESEFHTLLATLGSPWSGTLATEGYGDLLVGFIYNDETISPLSIGHILTDSAYEFAGRLPLQLTATLSYSTIDHILITRSLFEHYELDSTARLESVLYAFPDYVFTTSDHMPVYARFHFARATGVENSLQVPFRISIQALFPNPVRDRLSLSVEGATLDRNTDSNLRSTRALGTIICGETRNGSSNLQRGYSRSSSRSSYPAGQRRV